MILSEKSDVYNELAKTIQFLSQGSNTLFLENESSEKHPKIVTQLENPIEHESISSSHKNETTSEKHIEIQTTVEPLTIESSKNLDSLHARIHGCQKCPLFLKRKTIVFGQGNQTSNILFIGEGPGEDEDKTGLAFVGKAGKLLTQMIQSIGINRTSVYITNVVKCRPPGNRAPHEEEIYECSPILQQQIKLLQPKLILTLGNIATKHLIPNAPGITKAHGNVFTYEEIPVLPMFHPSYFLRKPQELYHGWNDMKKMRQMMLQLNLLEKK